MIKTEYIQKIQIILAGKDIGKDVSNIAIKEGMFRQFISVSFSFNDTKNLFNDIPIVGGEQIEISFYTDKTKFKKYFVLDSFNKSQANENKTMIDVKLISLSGIFSTETLCKAYSGNLNKIFESIVKETLRNKVYSQDNTIWEYKFVSNSWPVLKILKYLESRACSNTASDFLIYECLNGFNFRSLSKMMANPSEEKFIPSSNDQHKLAASEYFNLQYLDTKSYTSANAVGARGSLFTTFDVSNRQYKQVAFEYPGKNSSEFDIIQHNNYRYIPAERTDYYIDFLPDKASKNYDYANSKIMFSTYGLFERKLGRIITLYSAGTASQLERNKPGSYDKYISRDYLIVGIEHYIGNSYTQTLELIPVGGAFK